MRLIDADALIKYCDDNWIPLNVDAVNAQPTIEKRKRGHWITKSTNGEMFDCCSVCGYVEWDEPKNFCPNCGADMRGNG